MRGFPQFSPKYNYGNSQDNDGHDSAEKQVEQIWEEGYPQQRNNIPERIGIEAVSAE